MKMRKILIAVLALTVIAALVPAKASARHTLAHKVSVLEAKIGCLVKYPVTQFGDFAWYGTTQNDPTFAEADSTNPDSLTDVGPITGIDFDYFFQQDPAFPPDAWLIGIKNTSTCRPKFPLAQNPNPVTALAKVKARALARRGL